MNWLSRLLAKVKLGPPAPDPGSRAESAAFALEQLHDPDWEEYVRSVLELKQALGVRNPGPVPELESTQVLKDYALEHPFIFETPHPVTTLSGAVGSVIRASESGNYVAPKPLPDDFLVMVVRDRLRRSLK